MSATPPHAHAHGRSLSRAADQRALRTALALVAGLVLVELVAGAVAHSVALIADAAHMLTDLGALLGAVWALRLAQRPAHGVWTFGLQRAETLSAAVNGLALCVTGALVAVEGVRRLLQPPARVAGGVVMVVAALGAAVMLAATAVLARADRSNLGVEGALRHVLVDTAAFASTFLAGLVIVLTGFRRADAIASLVVVALIARAAWGLLRTSGRVLLEGAPEDVDLAEVRSHLLKTPHVRDVHDLHAWTVTSDLPALSAHVVLEDSCFSDGHAPQILDTLQGCLIGHFDLAHSTFQLEPAGHAAHEPGRH